jgi:hypothetical protein
LESAQTRFDALPVAQVRNYSKEVDARFGVGGLSSDTPSCHHQPYTKNDKKTLGF